MSLRYIKRRKSNKFGLKFLLGAVGTGKLVESKLKALARRRKVHK